MASSFTDRIGRRQVNHLERAAPHLALAVACAMLLPGLAAVAADAPDDDVEAFVERWVERFRSPAALEAALADRRGIDESAALDAAARAERVEAFMEWAFRNDARFRAAVHPPADHESWSSNEAFTRVTLHQLFFDPDGFRILVDGSRLQDRSNDASGLPTGPVEGAPAPLPSSTIPGAGTLQRPWVAPPPLPSVPSMAEVRTPPAMATSLIEPPSPVVLAALPPTAASSIPPGAYVVCTRVDESSDADCSIPAPIGSPIVVAMGDDGGLPFDYRVTFSGALRSGGGVALTGFSYALTIEALNPGRLIAGEVSIVARPEGFMGRVSTEGRGLLTLGIDGRDDHLPAVTLVTGTAERGNRAEVALTNRPELTGPGESLIFFAGYDETAAEAASEKLLARYVVTPARNLTLETSVDNPRSEFHFAVRGALDSRVDVTMSQESAGIAPGSSAIAFAASDVDGTLELRASRESGCGSVVLVDGDAASFVATMADEPGLLSEATCAGVGHEPGLLATVSATPLASSLLVTTTASLPDGSLRVDTPTATRHVNVIHQVESGGHVREVAAFFTEPATTEAAWSVNEDAAVTITGVPGAAESRVTVRDDSGAALEYRSRNAAGTTFVVASPQDLSWTLAASSGADSVHMAADVLRDDGVLVRSAIDLDRAPAAWRMNLSGDEWLISMGDGDVALTATTVTEGAAPPAWTECATAHSRICSRHDMASGAVWLDAAFEGVESIAADAASDPPTFHLLSNGAVSLATDMSETTPLGRAGLVSSWNPMPSEARLQLGKIAGVTFSDSVDVTLEAVVESFAAAAGMEPFVPDAVGDAVLGVRFQATPDGQEASRLRLEARDAPIEIAFDTGANVLTAFNNAVKDGRKIVVDAKAMLRLDIGLDEPRVSGAAAAHGRYVYYFGGRVSETDYRGDIVQFDSLTGLTRTMNAGFPLAINSMVAVTVGDYIYILGGRGAYAPNAGERNTIYRFDPVADTLELMPHILPHRIWLAGGATDGRNIYVTGGNLGRPYSDRIQVYDTVTGLATFHPAILPTPRQNLAAAWADGKLIIMGGEGKDGFGQHVEFDDILALDPDTGVLSRIASLPTKLHSFSAVSDGDRIYIIGGRNDNGFSNQMLVFDPDTASFIGTCGYLPSQRFKTAGAWVEDLLTTGDVYAVGGIGNGNVHYSDIIRFRVDVDTLDDITQPRIIDVFAELEMDESGPLRAGFVSGHCPNRAAVSAHLDTPGPVRRFRWVLDQLTELVMETVPSRVDVYSRYVNGTWSLDLDGRDPFHLVNVTVRPEPDAAPLLVAHLTDVPSDLHLEVSGGDSAPNLAYDANADTLEASIDTADWSVFAEDLARSFQTSQSVPSTRTTAECGTYRVRPTPAILDYSSNPATKRFTVEHAGAWTTGIQDSYATCKVAGTELRIELDVDVSLSGAPHVTLDAAGLSALSVTDQYPMTVDGAFASLDMTWADAALDGAIAVTARVILCVPLGTGVCVTVDELSVSASGPTSVVPFHILENQSTTWLSKAIHLCEAGEGIDALVEMAVAPTHVGTAPGGFGWVEGASGTVIMPDLATAGGAAAWPPRLAALHAAFATGAGAIEPTVESAEGPC